MATRDTIIVTRNGGTHRERIDRSKFNPAIHTLEKPKDDAKPAKGEAAAPSAKPAKD